MSAVEAILAAQEALENVVPLLRQVCKHPKDKIVREDEIEGQIACGRCTVCEMPVALTLDGRVPNTGRVALSVA